MQSCCVFVEKGDIRKGEIEIKSSTTTEHKNFFKLEIIIIEIWCYCVPIQS